MSLPATDGFTGFEQALSANWTIQTPSPNNNRPWIGFNNAQNSPADPAAAFWNADTFADDQYSQVVTVSDNFPGICVRATGTGATACGYGVLGNTANVLYRYTNWSFTVLQSGLGFSAPSVTMRLEAQGTSLRVYQNGVQKGTTVTDATFAGGSAGILMGQSAAEDDWEGGNLTGSTKPWYAYAQQ